MTLAPHPLNRGFVWRDFRPDKPRLLTSDQIADFHRDGFIILRKAFDPAEIANARKAIDAFESHKENTVLVMDDQPDLVFDVRKYSFACNLACRSAILRTLVSGPAFQGLVYDLIGQNVRLYWDQGVYKKPGQGVEFAWHQDNGYTFTLPQDYLTCWLPLTDATEENGCPRILRGVHRDGTYRHDHTENGLEICGLDKDLIDEKSASAAVDVGDVVVFSSLTPHMTGPNRTNEPRKAYIVQFIADGACLVKHNGDREPLDDSDNNFFILRNGAPA